MLIINSNRLILAPSYLQPIYSICLLNIIATLYFLTNYKYKIIKISACISSAYLLVLLLFCGIYGTVGTLYFRLSSYKNSSSYKTYEYIKNNLTPNDKIAEDHFVAIPSAMQGNSCHYWQGCGTDYIDEFNPNYVMFNEEFRFDNSIPAPNLRLQKYISDHHLKLVTKIKAKNIENGEIEISIYKK